jgi:hypothetical protein
MRAYVPIEKQKTIIEEIKLAHRKRSLSKRNVLSLIGRLNYIARIVKAGRPYLSRIIAAANTTKKLDHFVHLSKEVKGDLAWWLTFMSEFGGSVPLPRSAAQMTRGSRQLHTDASGTGYGALFGSDWLAVDLPEQHKDWSINIREAFAVALAMTTWLTGLTSRTVYLCCDNEAAVKILEKGRSKHHTIDRIVRCIFALCARHSIELVTCHTPGVQNGPADALSRADFDRFRLLAPWANLSMTEVIWPDFLLPELSA